MGGPLLPVDWFPFFGFGIRQQDRLADWGYFPFCSHHTPLPVLRLRHLHRGLAISMPRKLRLQCPGAMYHVMSRGDRRERIFLDDIDRQDFIKALAEAGQKTGRQVHA
jgi:hypothetical protein